MKKIDVASLPMHRGSAYPAPFDAAGEANGHHLQNRSDAGVVLLEVGSRRPDSDAVDYPGIDLRLDAGDRGYRHRDGTPYRPVAKSG